MNELKNTAQEGAENLTEGNKTFSQEDVNRIIQERLAKEKQKGQEALTAREQELAAKEYRLDATAVLREKGLPDELADMIKADSVEEFSKNVEAIVGLIGNRKETEEPQVIATGSVIGAIGGIGRGTDPIRDAFGLKK